MARDLLHSPRPGEAAAYPRAALTGSAALLLAACAVGPNFQPPAPPAVNRYTPDPMSASTNKAAVAGGESQSFVEGASVAGDWWTWFRSPTLTAVVTQALKANPDMAAARAGLRAAHETYLAQWGALLPSAEANYNVARQQASATLAPPLASNSNPFTLQTATVSVAYAADVFGGVRRQTEATRAQVDLARYQAEATYLTLTSNLVLAEFQEASLRAQIDATSQIISSAEAVMKITVRQHDLGQLSGADVLAQAALLAQARQTLPPLQKQWAQQRDLIADLTGHAPSDALPGPHDLESLSLPTELPVSLPAQLVEQRPDVLAARANLHVASAEVGVAIANRLPSFQLSANVGGAATNIANLFANGNSFWSLAAGVTQPIFQGGALLHRQRAAEASLDQAKAQYRSAVLGALQNVADCLQALDFDASALSAASAASDSAGRSLTIGRRQLELGQIGFVAVLNAEQTDQQARIALIQTRAARYADTVALFAALGGGWWARNDLGGVR